jgi:uncharacterized protein YrrD
MLARSDVIGLDVVELESGCQLGQVVEVMVDEQTRKLQGVVYRTDSGLRLARYRAVHSFGQDAVTLAASEPNCALSAPAKQNDKPWFSRLLGKPVLSEDGTDLGTIDDICFDEESGSLLGFRVSGGLIQDLTEGKELLPLQSRLTYGEDAVIVHDVG